MHYCNCVYIIIELSISVCCVTMSCKSVCIGSLFIDSVFSISVFALSFCNVAVYSMI